MHRDLFRALSQCDLNEGVLSFNGLDSNDVLQLNDILREALLGDEIPHYKVVGVHVTQGGFVSSSDYITKIRGTNKSYIELLNVFNDLIFAEARGSCSLYPDLNPTRLGLGYIMGVDNEVKSDNKSLFFEGCGVTDVAESLVKDLDVIKLNNPTSTIHLVTYRGTGLIDFTEASNLFFGLDLFKPVRAVYDLNNIFSISIPKLGDTTIKLWYKRDINEKVLLKILRDYGSDNM